MSMPVCGGAASIRQVEPFSGRLLGHGLAEHPGGIDPGDALTPRANAGHRFHSMVGAEIG